jgi:hypothetical protein
MKHLKIFETHLFEETKSLGQMPTFLKKAGAKEAIKGPGGGPRVKTSSDEKPNCWIIENIKNPFGPSEFDFIRFFPGGLFEMALTISPKNPRKFYGKWELGNSSDIFQLGNDPNGFKLSGVKMIFSTFGALQTYQ